MQLHALSAHGKGHAMGSRCAYICTGSPWEKVSTEVMSMPEQVAVTSYPPEAASAQSQTSSCRTYLTLSPATRTGSENSCICMHVCVCVCVCMTERRRRRRETVKEGRRHKGRERDEGGEGRRSKRAIASMLPVPLAVVSLPCFGIRGQ